MEIKSLKIKTPIVLPVINPPAKRKHGFVPGVSGNPAGRKKGVKNKFTTLKDAFVNAFQRIGGEDALYNWLTPETLEVKNKHGEVVRTIDFSANRHKEFFKIMATMLPRDVQVTAEVTNVDAEANQFSMDRIKKMRGAGKGPGGDNAKPS